jgi:superfamily II DNA or RNA helicase
VPPKPELLDNREPDPARGDPADAIRLHGDALRFLFESNEGVPLAVATGYTNLGGLHDLATLADGRPIRLMLGAAPDPGLGSGVRPFDYFNEQLKQLQDERDFSRFPPSRSAEKLAAIEKWLASGEIEVRRYLSRFLHGKAYIFGDDSAQEAAVISSANLTAAGLWRNLELGAVNYQPSATGPAIRWFDDLWEEAAPYRDELRSLLFPEIPTVTPEDVYLRALLELHRPLDDEPDRPTLPSLQLADFQRDGYERARAIANRHSGVIYADGVGTGKTEIGLAFIEERTKETGHYALVVTPAQLKKRWQDRLNEVKLPAQVVSFSELATDEQLQAPGEAGGHRRLSIDKDAYRIVIVDEAHALRNEDTSWHRAMERLLGGSEKQVVLLTATPINNTLWDLYNLVLLFARHDLGLARAGIDSIRNLFVQAGANSRDPEDLDPEVLYPLAEAVSVRRDRAFIKANYENARFPDGTPVQFPEPKLTTIRYDLDEAHPGLFAQITEQIGALSMARYTPSRFDLTGSPEQAEAQLAGLLQSGILKRFESCWEACLSTVERMLNAHQVFLEAWDEGQALVGEHLLEAVEAEDDGVDLADWLSERIGAEGSRDTSGFDPEFREQVAADRERLLRVCELLRELDAQSDPKLATLIAALEGSPARKVAVFATFGDTIGYLNRNLPESVGGRDRIAVIGSQTDPDQRTRALARFAPKTIIGESYEPPEGEVDLLLATDVLSEGQNLQQAQAVISYDMPWNPQRVVQRNGRVIRLRSEHAEAFLTTMLPEPGELEELLGLEARIEGKIKAASVYGMETEVVARTEAEATRATEEELRAFADRIEEGDESLLDEQEEASGAFVGEELRRMVDRAAREGLVARVQRLPWGVGACFRQVPGGRSRGRPGIFFATRTPPMPDADSGYRYWRYLEAPDAEPLSLELEILRRIDPKGGEPADLPESIDLEAYWSAAAQNIVEEHNARIDLRETGGERIGPKQRWALTLLRDPTVSLPSEQRAERASAALSVALSTTVRRRLGELQALQESGEISRDEAATGVIALVEEFGLRPVKPLPRPEEITVDDLGVVCWMAVLPSSAAKVS